MSLHLVWHATVLCVTWHSVMCHLAVLSGSEWHCLDCSNGNVPHQVCTHSVFLQMRTKCVNKLSCRSTFDNRLLAPVAAAANWIWIIPFQLGASFVCSTAAGSYRLWQGLGRQSTSAISLHQADFTKLALRAMPALVGFVNTVTVLIYQLTN